MVNNNRNATYWNNRYCEQNIPWDIGGVAPALQRKFNLLGDKNKHILIPGAGSAHEAIHLHQAGFQNVLVCDWAVDAFNHLKKQCPDFPSQNLIVNDFFDLDLKVDVIVEQTFFYAIDPSQRTAYVKKAAELLNEDGVLFGLLFASEFERQGPPFGGTKEVYEAHFSPHFEIQKLEMTTESI
ncbi:MAG TPA: SAM-dependent methyltransferase, partial [Saprospiraceae bacterium]|nr:SAM-dependent methyltransferase [Saprospiraceae bacterium]